MQPTPNEPGTSTDKPTSDLIYQYLNSLRTRPVESQDRFDTLITELKNQNKPNKLAEKQINYIESSNFP